MKLLLLSAAVAVLYAQQKGTNQAENHPSLTTYTCAASGDCTPVVGSITLDANWRWTHAVGSSTNCYTGDEWDTGLCPDPVTCAKNCAIDGADYAGTYGINTVRCGFGCGGRSLRVTAEVPAALTRGCRSLSIELRVMAEPSACGSRVFIAEWRRDVNKVGCRWAVRHEHWRPDLSDEQQQQLRAACPQEPRVHICR